MSIQKNIIMYTTSWCPDCRAAKRYLSSKGLQWQEIDIEKEEGAAEKVVAWSGGYQTVPTFDIEGSIVVDFDRAKLNAALGL